MGSSTWARTLLLLGQLNNLRKGNNSVADYLGLAQVVIEELALAGGSISLDEQKLYVFRRRPEFRYLRYTGVVVRIV